ncbi:DUF494 domain-containing protein [Inmirania thermothiophila]|uniref:Protein Smg homolog n=1 Tax=Inmirania thermothiophila TaxID=1750597 RepID=A0A3N1Y615_9GAMM|nr:DUF494 domain-containing protein [Inmirania thermothiophila]ROR34256.1 Smg protein [Inmirania thermothiophila]
MNETILDVLVYLFEHYMEAPAAEPPSEEALRSELEEQGFDEEQIERAFDWLEELGERQESLPGVVAPGAIRIYTEAEVARLDLEARGLLLDLEQRGVLDHRTRELVLDRLLALDEPHLGREAAQWVALMVLFSEPGREAAYAWMRDYVYQLPGGALH